MILFSLFSCFQTNICPNIAIFPITEVKCLAGVTAINLYNTWTKITIIMSWTIFTNTLCKKRIQMRADQLGISNVCICGGNKSAGCAENVLLLFLQELNIHLWSMLFLSYHIFIKCLEQDQVHFYIYIFLFSVWRTM